MGVDDGWMPILGICHILSMIEAVLCVFLRDGSLYLDDVIMDCHTPVE